MGRLFVVFALLFITLRLPARLRAACSPPAVYSAPLYGIQMLDSINNNERGQHHSKRSRFISFARANLAQVLLLYVCLAAARSAAAASPPSGEWHVNKHHSAFGMVHGAGKPSSRKPSLHAPQVHARNDDAA